MDDRVARLGDVALGAVGYAASAAGAVLRKGEQLAAPVLPHLAHPPLVPERISPGHVLDRIAERGRATRLSLTAEAKSRLDVLVPEVTDIVLDRIDLTSVALTRLDIERIVKAALAELDLTSIAREQVDLIGLAEYVVEEIDLTSIARDQVDLIGLAEYVVEEIDLPEIIRGSSGMVASEAVRGVRMQSMEADEAVSRLVDKMLLRRRKRRTDAPGEPESSAEPPT